MNAPTTKPKPNLDRKALDFERNLSLQVLGGLAQQLRDLAKEYAGISDTKPHALMLSAVHTIEGIGDQTHPHVLRFAVRQLHALAKEYADNSGARPITLMGAAGRQIEIFSNQLHPAAK